MRAISLIKQKRKEDVGRLVPGDNKYVSVRIRDIKKGSPFISLFPIKPEVLKSISEDMSKRGFDPSQPIIIWKEANLLIDGHTRCAAAEKTGIEKVVAIYESFPDVDSALRYAYGLQFKRRNLSDADRFHFSETYLNNVGQGVKKSGWKKKELAEILSVSTGTAQKYISVLSRGTGRDKLMVRSGEKTINNVYKSLLGREKAPGGNRSEEVKKDSVKALENPDGSITLELSMIYKKLDSLAGRKTGLKSDLFSNREKIRGIIEILPNGSEIKGYASELIKRLEE